MNWNNRTVIIFILSAILALNASCLNEHMDDCGRVCVRFDYSYNMLSVNAFDNQSDQVTLYVFEKSSKKLLLKESATGSALTNDFSFNTNRLEAGEYIFAAWAQGASETGNGTDFRIPDLTVGSATIDELSYYLERNGNASDRPLNNLLVGMCEVVIGNTTEIQQDVIVHLKKVNRTVRVILLPYADSNHLDVSDYEIAITDKTGNAHLNYDYTLLTDEEIAYYPYFKANSRPASNEVLYLGEIEKAAVVEISLSRIIEVNNPKLLIKEKKSDRTIVNIALPWLLSLTSMESHQEWGLQEYLDRQDEFAVTLFINNTTWMGGTIMINGWIINNITLEM